MAKLGEARAHCRELLGLHDRIQSRTGPAREGLPDFSPIQQQLFIGDFFHIFLVATIVEYDFGVSTVYPPSERKSSLQALH